MSAANTSIGESWRLPPVHVQDLNDVAQGVEEMNAGICTRYLLDELERAGPPGEDSIHMFDAERFCDEFAIAANHALTGWRKRIVKCRRVLASLITDALLPEARDHQTVGVLHIVYGHPDPFVREVLTPHAIDFLKELSPLARYTNEAEEIRRMLVRDQALRHRINGVRWSAPSDGLTDVIDLGRHRAVDRYYDRIVSSSEAMRFIMGEARVPRHAGEDEKAWNRRRGEIQRQHEVRRRSFLVAARIEADAMLTRASRVYHAAWRQMR